MFCNSKRLVKKAPNADEYQMCHDEKFIFHGHLKVRASSVLTGRSAFNKHPAHTLQRLSWRQVGPGLHSMLAIESEIQISLFGDVCVYSFEILLYRVGAYMNLSFWCTGSWSTWKPFKISGRIVAEWSGMAVIGWYDLIAALNQSPKDKRWSSVPLPCSSILWWKLWAKHDKVL